MPVSFSDWQPAKQRSSEAIAKNDEPLSQVHSVTARPPVSLARRRAGAESFPRQIAFEPIKDEDKLTEPPSRDAFKHVCQPPHAYRDRPFTGKGEGKYPLSLSHSPHTSQNKQPQKLKISRKLRHFPDSTASDSSLFFRKPPDTRHSSPTPSLGLTRHHRISRLATEPPSVTLTPRQPARGDRLPADNGPFKKRIALGAGQAENL